MPKLKLILYLNILCLVFIKAKTLKEVVHENIYSNPQVRMAIENYKASLYELEKVKSGYKPILNISSEIGQEYASVDYSLEGAKLLTEEQILLKGKYNLFEGFKTNHQVKEKESALNVAKEEAFKKINGVTSLLVQVYLNVLRRKELWDIEIANYQNHQETLEKVKLRLQAGDGYESDYRQSKARLKLAETNKLIVKKMYKNAEINYRRLTGVFPQVEMLSLPSLSFSLDSTKISAYIEKAQKNNPHIKIQHSEIAISKSLYQQERSKSYPTLDVEVSQSWNNNVHGFEGKDKSSKIALILNYNLYNGGANQASERSALRKSEMNERSLDDIKLTLEEDIRLSLMQYDMLSTQLELINQQLIHLEGTRELYELEYQNNKRTIIDVLNIKQEYRYAQSQKINAHYDQLLAYYQFQSDMGTLFEEFELDRVLDIQ